MSVLGVGAFAVSGLPPMRLGQDCLVRNDEQAEKWLGENGWRRADLGSISMWTHDHLVREGGKLLLTFVAAIDRQKQWDRRRYSS
jgi:hypothetical protein